MSQTTELKMENTHVNGLEPHQSPHKAHTRQINNTIRSKIEFFEKCENLIPPKPQQVPASMKQNPVDVFQKQESPKFHVDENETVPIVKEIIEKAAKDETVGLPFLLHDPLSCVVPSEDKVLLKSISDCSSKEAKVLLDEKRKLLESHSVDVKTDDTESIDDNLRESAGVSLNVSFPRAIDFAKHHQRPLWRDVRGIQELGLLENMTKEARVRQEAKFELMMSEASYLHSQNILNFHYMTNIQKHITLVLSEVDYEILFEHACDVRACSEAFLEAMDKVWQLDPMLNNIYEVVTEHTNQHFGPYVKYCRNMLEMRDHLVHLTTTNEPFENLLKVLINREAAEKLSLYSFLTSPMQRITKLPLLMKTILEKLDNDSEEHAKCVTAYEAVIKIAAECDAAVNEKKQMEELFKLWSEFEFEYGTKKIPIVKPGRVLVSRADVKNFTFCDRTPEYENLQLVLFSDLLMVTKKKSNKLQSVVDYCDRDQVQLKGMDTPSLYTQVKNSKHLKPVLITMLNNSQDQKLDLVVTFKDKAQCQEWLGLFAVESEKNLNLVQAMGLPSPESPDPDPGYRGEQSLGNTISRQEHNSSIFYVESPISESTKPENADKNNTYPFRPRSEDASMTVENTTVPATIERRRRFAMEPLGIYFEPPVFVNGHDANLALKVESCNSLYDADYDNDEDLLVSLIKITDEKLKYYKEKSMLDEASTSSDNVVKISIKSHNEKDEDFERQGKIKDISREESELRDVVLPMPWIGNSLVKRTES